MVLLVLTCAYWSYCFQVDDWMTQLPPSLLMIWLYQTQYIWSNYSDLTRPHPKWWLRKGNLVFQGNLGWWNIMIWPDIFKNSVKILQSAQYVYSLKLTYPLKTNAWKMGFFFGLAYFQGLLLLVSWSLCIRCLHAWMLNGSPKAIRSPV